VTPRVTEHSTAKSDAPFITAGMLLEITGRRDEPA